MPRRIVYVILLIFCVSRQNLVSAKISDDKVRIKLGGEKSLPLKVTHAVASRPAIVGILRNPITNRLVLHGKKCGKSTVTLEYINRAKTKQVRVVVLCRRKRNARRLDGW